jgi:hypothetical protein
LDHACLKIGIDLTIGKKSFNFSRKAEDVACYIIGSQHPFLLIPLSFEASRAGRFSETTPSRRFHKAAWGYSVRQSVPLSSPFAGIGKAELKRIDRFLNDRPRKCMGWMTPREKMTVFLGFAS